MSRIICGMFDVTVDADAALEALQARRLPAQRDRLLLRLAAGAERA